MPAGLDVTVPLAMPLLGTVNGKPCILKIAVTERALAIVTVHVAPDTESHPVHPVKSEPAAGAAVSVTAESLTKVAEQAPGHWMPAGVEVTVPLPSPWRMTPSASMSFTVTT